MEDSMSNEIVSKQQNQRPRVLFFGMQGNFSSLSLQALLESNIDVCAVVLPASPVPGLDPPAIQRREQPRAMRSALPLLSTSLHPSIAQISWKHQIPVWEVHRLSDATTLSTLAAYQPDILCVACFSQRISRVIIDLPRLGCLNVHPSLLPVNRGPVPLFWTFREGSTTTGVTIHFLNEKMDTGDILAQQSIDVPDGITYTQLEVQCAQLGGTLLARTVWNLYQDHVSRTPQDETKSSYHSFPAKEDFVVYAEEWSARHLYNFIRGVGHWDAPIELYTNNTSFLVRDAISYSQTDTDDRFNQMNHIPDSELDVQCKLGWVKVKSLK